MYVISCRTKEDKFIFTLISLVLSLRKSNRPHTSTCAAAVQWHWDIQMIAKLMGQLQLSFLCVKFDFYNQEYSYIIKLFEYKMFYVYQKLKVDVMVGKNRLNPTLRILCTHVCTEGAKL